jgi:predicted nucleic acid-binding protein
MLWDTGPLYAAFDRDDKHHAASAALMLATAPPLLVPAPVMVEVCYHLQKHLGARAEIAFLRSVQRGQLRLLAPEPAEFERAVELVEQYQGFPLGVVDAHVMAMAERMNITKIASIDHRHFHAVKLRHCDGLELLPS